MHHVKFGVKNDMHLSCENSFFPEHGPCEVVFLTRLYIYIHTYENDWVEPF